MSAVDEQSGESYTVRARVRRDLRTILQILRIVKVYFTTGASIRRGYRDKERRGEIYYFD